MHDLVIRGAFVVDGTGRPGQSGDVAVDGDRITEVGAVDGAGRREVDADGLVLAPGWVDIHTHYDGQATWDPQITPSSWHGVTTVVMGNCGVGFAPVRPGAEDFLIELMEGVEDIPGSALHEGMDWQWETFPQYLDALAGMPRVLDVAAQVPHAAVRAYVMGERAHDEATADDLAAMTAIVGQAMAAGAVGFTTSRTILHRSRHGYVPGTFAAAEELLAIGDGLPASCVVEMVSDQAGTEPERAWMAELARRSGATVTYALAQVPWMPTGYREALDHAVTETAAGRHTVPQVSCRPTGMLFGLQSSLHPFITHSTYRAVADLPLAERVACLRKAEVRSRLLGEEAGTDNAIARSLMTRWADMFPLGDPPDYEPSPERSVAATAAREGRRPEEVVLDWLLERDGTALVFAPLASYVDGDHEAIREMMTHPGTVLGLSDGGAHCGLICDASMTTYLLTHWVRDRSRGERLPLETAVHLQTGRTVAVYRLDDRGTIAPGKRADLNLIELDALELHVPEMVFDLPAGGRRLVQQVDGYRATFCAGEMTFDDGEPTGALPGRLVPRRPVASAGVLSDDEVSARARRLAAAIEPVAGQVYFSPECHAAYGGLGFGPSPGFAGMVALPDGPAYFSSRGSVLGQVPGQLVAAAFAVFNPAAVVPAVTYGWSLTDAATVCAARTDGAVSQLVRILGPRPDGLERASELMARAVAPLRPEGRPLYAGLLSLGLPDDPVGRAWRLADQLREYRGDAHTAAWTAAGFDATEIGLLTELYWGLPMRTYVRTRAWSDADLDGAEQRLVERGLVADHAFTAAGRSAREEVERSTDRQCRPLVTALGDGLDDLVAILTPWGAAIRAQGGYLAAGPHDLAGQRGAGAPS